MASTSILSRRGETDTARHTRSDRKRSRVHAAALGPAGRCEGDVSGPERHPRWQKHPSTGRRVHLRFCSNPIRHATCTRSVELPQALGRALRHRAVPADVARRDGRARLGQLRRDRRHGRCVRRSPQLRHGHRRTRARGAGLPRRHHRAARLAQRRAVRRARPPEPVLRHHRGEHGLDGEPLHRGPAHPQRRRVHAGRRRRQAAGPLRHRLRAARARSLQRRADRRSAESRLRCDASRTSTTGRRRCAARSCSTPRPICSCSATPSARSARSRTGSPPARAHRRHHRPARHRVRAPVPAARLDRDRLDAPRHARPAEPAGRSVRHGGQRGNEGGAAGAAGGALRAAT